jgi:hypothetical protein
MQHKTHPKTTLFIPKIAKKATKTANSSSSSKKEFSVEMLKFRIRNVGN